MKIPSVYVEIRGDSTQLRKDITAVKQIVTESAKGMSNALNNALSPGQISGGINKLIGNLGTLSRASDQTSKQFDSLGVDLKDLQRITGITAGSFATLQSKMMATKAAKLQERALRDIATAANLTEKEIRELGQQFGLSAAQIKSVSASTHQASGSMTLLGGAARTALAYLSVYQVYEFGKAVLDTGIKVDSLKRSFVAITGSTEGMESEFAFMKQTAAETGQNMYALADSYRQLTASTQDTILEGQKTRDLFQAMSEASAVLGLSNERVELSMKAFAQMAAKGVVQMEELKNQLGDSLPGAVNIAARAMGVSQAALMKMSAAGELLAVDLLPKMAEELHKMYGVAANVAALESGQAAVNRLSQAWTEFKNNLYDNETAVASINLITKALDGAIRMQQAHANSKGIGGLLGSSKGIGEQLGEMRAQQEAALAIAGEYAVGREAIAAESAKRVQAIETGLSIALKSHKEQEYQYYIDAEKAKADAVVKAYDEQAKASNKAFTNQGKAEAKAYDAVAENRKRLAEELTDALAKEGKTQTQIEIYELKKRYAENLKIAGNNIELAKMATQVYEAELKKRAGADRDYNAGWLAFQNKQQQTFVDGWQGAAERRLAIDESANKELENNTSETTSVIVSEWSNAYASIQSSLADMIYEFDFSMDSILDIFKRMLAEMAAAIIMSGVKNAFLNMFDGNAATSAWGGMISGITGAIGKGDKSPSGTPSVGTAGAAGWGTIGGTVAVAGGAYGMYAGAKNIKDGNAGVGALQTGLGAYSAYKGAVTLGIVEKGAITEAAKLFAAKLGYAATQTGVGTVATESTFAIGKGAVAAQTTGTGTGAATGASASSYGASAAGAAAYAVPIAAAVMVAMGAYQKSQRPQAENEIDKRGITPGDLGQFYEGWRSIKDTIVETIPGISQYEQALYDANSGLLVATSATSTLALQYNASAEAGHQWEMALHVGGEATRNAIIASEEYANALGVSGEGMGKAAEIAYVERDAMEWLSDTLNGTADAAGNLSAEGEGLSTAAMNAASSTAIMASTVQDMGSISQQAANKISGAWASIGGISSDAKSFGAGYVIGPSTGSTFAHADGFVTKRATWFGNHEIGEDGTEALLPVPGGPDYFSRQDKRLDKIEQMISSMSGGSGPITIVLEVEGEAVAKKIIPRIDQHVADKARRGQLSQRTAYATR